MINLSMTDAKRRFFPILITLFVSLLIIGCNKTEPAAAASPSSDAPIGYTVAASTDSGKSLVTQKSNVTTVQAALLATLPDLAAYFDARPTIGTAYQDAHDPTTGGTTFGATLNGQPVRGIVSCKLHDGGASIAVVYGRTDAPKADWEKLMKPSADQAAPAAAGAQAPAAAAPPIASGADPNVSLKEYDYADGTGSVGLVDGWNTQSQSVLDPTVIAGPANQAVILHNSVNVQTPDSMAVQQRQRLLDMQAQNAANFAQRGYQMPTPKPLPPLMVAPFTDPATAVQNMMPQFSKRSEFNNGPSLALDRIISSQDLPCQMPNGKRALISYAFTRTVNGESVPYRAQIMLVVVPLQGTAWMWFARYSVQAPDATYDHDLPTMLAMVNSEKENRDREIEVANARNQQMRQMGQAMADAAEKQRQASYEMFQQNQQTQYNIHQEQQAQTQAGYDAHNQQFRDDQLQRSRSAADFNESIIGTRTIYDNVTGQSGYANLTDVNGVVDSLNQAALDPNRFVQIPLRDQLYPLPPGK
ncbi:MAG TPA: hypothetical protein VGG44_08670 [Tepidisphaeraceae bacterium]|jgi:hypothetical protein